MSFFRRDKNITPVAEVAPTTVSAGTGLPDSSTLKGTCARCGLKSSFALAGTNALTYGSGPLLHGARGESSRLEVERAATLVCAHCGQGVEVIEELWIGDRLWIDATVGGSFSWRGVFWWPLPAAQRTADVPLAISECLSEATQCLWANCPRAAAVMARRTLEAVCEDKGATGQTLAANVKSLFATGQLPKPLMDWADEVRLIGNQGPHFDVKNPVTRADANELLRFLDDLLRYVYELPGELARRRAAPP
jgi:Domain of unknown function (DUF4145)